ncbi:MAG TPA: S9 family peptidase [Bryobacteraceae bacterium]|nr:S9 family peptidase [Bryobacteraceae bacterium]
MHSPRLPIFLAAACAALAQTAPHPLRLDDIPRIREVRDPQCSPDGQWVAYSVGTTDAKEDKHDSDIWMVSYDGKRDLQITSSPESETAPRWSPDGRYLTFLSSRPGKARGNQVWLLDRQGGEATQLTDVKGRLQSYEWSPDSKRLALVVGDPDPDNPDGAPEGGGPAAGGGGSGAGGGRGGRAPKPIVIDRYKFKQDGAGYLLSNRHNFIYLFDVATRKLERLTTSKTWDESSPAWSPDGSKIAFLSNHNVDPDRDPDNQVYIADAKPGSTEKQLTPLSSRAGRGRPEWAPDGRRLAFLVGDEKQWGAYNMERLATVAADGSDKPALVKAAADLDRGVSSPRFNDDGSAISFLVADDRSVYPARLRSGGAVERLIKTPIVLTSPNVKAGCSVAIAGGDNKFNEIYAFENGSLRQLTHQNDALRAELQFGEVEEVAFKSKDGTEVHGLLTKPVHYTGGKVPLLLRIHGGPNGQDAHSLSTEHQWFAANGYAVLAVNYRGSSGRGQKYSRAIFADWGHYEVEDLEAGVDHVMKMGIADPDRLGVGGWSYGAILTDYMIASDTRFKAATSGAGTAFTVAFYGTDQYIIQYDYELGPPWKNFDTYMKISYPFLHADRIKTPTLFLGGERDFNVPVQGGQQMYQALRSLGIDTALVIYPNETHGIQRPSYQRDRLERYLAWYNKYLKPTNSVSAPPAQ